MSAVFRTGKVVRPTSVVKASPHVVLRANFLHQVGHAFEVVYVKLLPFVRRDIEIACAWLAKDVGLPCPEPVLGITARSKLPMNCAWPYANEEETCFGTVGIPQVRPVRRVDTAPLQTLLANWPYFVDAAVFDQLIANEDRSEDNLLLDANSKLWLIDHDRALGGAGEALFSNPAATYKNILVERLKALPAPQRLARRNDILRACGRLVEATNRIPYSALGIDTDVAAQMRLFFEVRGKVLTQTIFAEIGMPDIFDAYGAKPPLH